VELIVVPRSKVAKHLLSASRGALYKSLISIGDPGSALPPGYRKVSSRLRLEFQDIVDPSDPLAPTLREVDQLLAYAPTVARLGGRCLVHCEAGISRSTAAGIIVLRAILGPGSEAEAVSIVVAQVPEASPNSRMIALADQRLGGDEAIARAIAAHRA
jgi:predicted protein tyrosine phosphatase